MSIMRISATKRIFERASCWHCLILHFQVVIQATGAFDPLRLFDSCERNPRLDLEESNVGNEP